MQTDRLESDPVLPRTKVRHKLVLSHIAVTLGAVLLAEALTLGARYLLTGLLPSERPGWGPYVVLEIAIVAGAALLLGLWANRSLTHRLQRVLEVCRTWLRGNLSLRIADPVADDLGLLAGQLDLLSEHLRQDERDLAELHEYNTRTIDQVRALAVDEERDRLARELHDGVKQHLFSLSMTASAIRTHLEGRSDTSPDLKEMAQEVETTSKTVQRDLTRLIENLRPGSLEEKGLAAALNDYALLFGAREHILVYLDAQGNDALLPPSVAESLYRMAQEALHNVARHARATRVDIRLRCLTEQATLTLSDNGVGFDTRQAHRGLGLGNMQDRMMSVGGRLSIDSAPGSGTTVRAEVGLTRPLSSQAESIPQDRERPTPRIENWAWLGQRLVIPVGQTWPWLPADRVHLRQPLMEPGDGPLNVAQGSGLLGLRRRYLLQRQQNGPPLARIRGHRWGYAWRSEGAAWALQHVRGPRNTSRAVLLRNEQPLAAAQLQGRLLNTWTEIVYDERGYRLSQARTGGSFLLTDQSGEELLSIEGGAILRVKLCRALPLPLLAMVIACVGDEAVSSTHPAETLE
jgi:signal transduction histidine kinase